MVDLLYSAALEISSMVVWHMPFSEKKLLRGSQDILLMKAD